MTTVSLLREWYRHPEHCPSLIYQIPLASQELHLSLILLNTQLDEDTLLVEISLFKVTSLKPSSLEDLDLDL